MAQMRHLNEDMFKVLNDLWVSQIGRDNIYKLKFVLTYIITYLEEYLSQCEKRFKLMERGDIRVGHSDNLEVNLLSAALEGFVRLEDDKSFGSNSK